MTPSQDYSKVTQYIRELLDDEDVNCVLVKPDSCGKLSIAQVYRGISLPSEEDLENESFPITLETLAQFDKKHNSR
ncbi:MAG: hypothetical protein U9Q06_04910 [Nanoarchaeota archaeon]|nr:hypothetical protein [Nanoarchaeota archaeon]